MNVEIVGWDIHRHRNTRDVESTLWVYDVKLPDYPAIITLKCYDEYTNKSWQEEWVWLGDKWEPLIPTELAKKLRRQMITDLQKLFAKGGGK